MLPERDSNLAEALAEADEELLMPDFWLNEACNICWLQVHKGKWTSGEAREALALLRTQVSPTPTGGLDRFRARHATPSRSGAGELARSVGSLGAGAGPHMTKRIIRLAPSELARDGVLALEQDMAWAPVRVRRHKDQLGDRQV